MQCCRMSTKTNNDYDDVRGFLEMLFDQLRNYSPSEEKLAHLESQIDRFEQDFIRVKKKFPTHKQHQLIERISEFRRLLCQEKELFTKMNDSLQRRCKIPREDVGHSDSCYYTESSNYSMDHESGSRPATNPQKNRSKRIEDGEETDYSHASQLTFQDKSTRVSAHLSNQTSIPQVHKTHSVKKGFHKELDQGYSECDQRNNKKVQNSPIARGCPAQKANVMTLTNHSDVGSSTTSRNSSQNRSFTCHRPNAPNEVRGRSASLHTTYSLSSEEHANNLKVRGRGNTGLYNTRERRDYDCKQVGYSKKHDERIKLIEPQNADCSNTNSGILNFEQNNLTTPTRQVTGSTSNFSTGCAYNRPSQDHYVTSDQNYVSLSDYNTRGQQFGRPKSTSNNGGTNEEITRQAGHVMKNFNRQQAVYSGRGVDNASTHHSYSPSDHRRRGQQLGPLKATNNYEGTNEKYLSQAGHDMKNFNSQQVIYSGRGVYNASRHHSYNPSDHRRRGQQLGPLEATNHYEGTNEKVLPQAGYFKNFNSQQAIDSGLGVEYGSRLHSYSPSDHSRRGHDSVSLENQLHFDRITVSLPETTYNKRDRDNITLLQQQGANFNGGQLISLQQEAAPLDETLEQAQEAVEDTLEVIDVHQYFEDDFDLNSLDSFDDVLTKIDKIEEWARRFEIQVEKFSESKYSLEYFVLDEKLMRFIERLDRYNCQDDMAARDRKVEVTKYIKKLLLKLDSNASDD